MKASDDLKHEHDAILFSLKILEEICNRVKSGQHVSLRDIDCLIDFFKIFADKCHHTKEEGFLFPALEKAGNPKVNDLIGVLLSEHEKGRECIKLMQEAISGDTVNIEKFFISSGDYIILLRSHIEKENSMLFPMGDAKLTESDQENLLEKFDDFEMTVIGEEKHERFHEMLTKLKKKYL